VRKYGRSVTAIGAGPLVFIEDGCMFCGVGYQTVSAVVVAREGRENVARDLWTAKRTRTQQLGGQLSPQQLCGYLCRVCASAVEHVGAMGPTALERALVVALAQGDRDPVAPCVTSIPV
jgi:hypothetical protein